MRLPVFVASWQIECCWAPPSVGDVIGWRLVFVETADADCAFERGQVRQLEVTGKLFGDGRGPAPSGPDGQFAIQLEAPDVSLYWMARRPALGPLQLSGFIHEDHHAEAPDTLPVTWGIVRGIGIEERTYIESAPGSRSWVPADEPPRYTDVATSPKWFGRQRSQDAHLAGWTTQTGILVKIETVAR